MRGYRIVFLAVCSISVADCASSRGDQPRKRNAKLETLEVENDGPSALTVWIRAQNGPKDAKEWQTPFTVNPNKTNGIALYGIQPFDITIQVDDDTAYRLDNVPICTQMAECTKAPDCTWKAKGLRRGADRRWQRDESMDTELQLKVDKGRARILFQLAGKKPDLQNPPDPNPKPPPPPPRP